MVIFAVLSTSKSNNNPNKIESHISSKLLDVLKGLDSGFILLTSGRFSSCPCSCVSRALNLIGPTLFASLMQQTSVILCTLTWNFAYTRQFSELEVVGLGQHHLLSREDEICAWDPEWRDSHLLPQLCTKCVIKCVLFQQRGEGAGTWMSAYLRSCHRILRLVFPSSFSPSFPSYMCLAFFHPSTN